jgi:Mce-associated membrane protein
MIGRSPVAFVAAHTRLVLIALGAAAVVLAGALAALLYVAVQQRDSTAAGQQALEVARTAAVSLLSYEHQSVDVELAEASEQLTGPFQADFRSLTTSQVVPAAKQRQVDTHAQVVAASVVNVTREHVTVLLFLNQSTQGAGLPAPTISGSRVRMTLDKVADRWLVSGMTPV